MEYRMSSCSACHDRRGAALMMAIIAIVIGATMAVVLVQLAVAQRKQHEIERRRSQAEWYAEAAVARAIAKWQADDTYQQEQWTVSETASGRELTANIAITVHRDSEPPRLTVVADYPVGELHRSRSRRDVTLENLQGATAVSALQPENRP